MRPDDAWAHAERGRRSCSSVTPRRPTRTSRWRWRSTPTSRRSRLLADLAGKPQAFDALDDGRVLLAAYRDDPKVAGWSDFPIVSVLEKNIVDVRADGSTLELQHKLRIVQSKAAADALGDFAPPDGARLLVARTLKADGRVLYPERTQGKADLSFPELQVGDAVETAYVVRSRVSPGEGGYLTGVSFAGWSAPTYRQDARFHLAKGLALVATRFAGAPEPAVTREADGSRTWAWTGLTLPPVPREPLAVGARSLFPFADLRVAVDGDGVDAAEGAERAWQAIATSFAARLERVLAARRRARRRWPGSSPRSGPTSRG
ncbi:MAG: hypothetical protein U1F43_09830 [Myxococcota bacterium]